MASRFEPNLKTTFSTRTIRFWVAMFAALSLTFTVVAIAPAWAVPSYPSWAEVQAAKKKVAAKKAMIKRLEDIIAAQQVVADKLGKEALIKGEAFNQAQDDAMAFANINTLAELNALAPPPSTP